MFRKDRRVSIFLFLSCLVTFNVWADDAEVIAQSAAHEVRLLGYKDRPHSRLRRSTVREYRFEATSRKNGQRVVISLGGDYLLARHKLQEIRIFESQLVVTAHVGIFVLNLNNGRRLKFLRILGPTSSPSGRFIAYREWQTRAMPQEMLGAIVSVLDLKTLERRPVYPVSTNLREALWRTVPDEFESYFNTWEADPSQRCATWELLWSADDSRLAFLCGYDRAKVERRPAPPELRGLALVVVHPITDLENAVSRRFEIPDEAFRVPGSDSTEDDSPRIEETGWLDKHVFEINPTPKPWFRERILIDVTTGEIQIDS